VFGSGDKLCEPLSALLQAAAHLLPTISQLLLQALFNESLHRELPLPLSPVERLVSVYFCRFCLPKVCVESVPSSLLWWRSLSAGYFCRLCLLKVCMEFSSLLLPPSLVHSKHPALSAACPFQFLVYSVVFLFCFLWDRGQSCPGGYAGLSQWWLWDYSILLICSPVGLHLLRRFQSSVW
jgi:hypothetical protein